MIWKIIPFNIFPEHTCLLFFLYFGYPVQAFRVPQDMRRCILWWCSAYGVAKACVLMRLEPLAVVLLIATCLLPLQTSHMLHQQHFVSLITRGNKMFLVLPRLLIVL